MRIRASTAGTGRGKGKRKRGWTSHRVDLRLEEELLNRGVQPFIQ